MPLASQIMKNILPVALLSCFCLLSACSTNNDDVETLRTQDVLFHYASWDPLSGLHEGWFISGAGEVMGYKNPQDWMMADDKGSISTADMQANLAQADSSMATIKSRIMNQRTGLISEAAKGELVAAGSSWNASRNYHFVAYQFDASEDFFQEVVLARAESAQYVNTNTAAQDLVAWMEGI